MGNDTNVNIGNSGEYFVAGELERRGYTVAVPMSNVKDFDLLAIERDTHRQIAIQVKTTGYKQKKWTLSKKNETLLRDDIFYIFVSLNELESPEYHIVPSKIVADTIRKNHEKWLNTPGKKGQKHNNTNIREFYDLEDTYLDQWELLKMEFIDDSKAENGIYSSLTRYISKFSNPSRSKVMPENNIGDGTMEHPYQLPYREYSREVEDFVKDIYAFESRHPEYQLNRYIFILRYYGIQWDENEMSNANIDELNGQAVLALIMGAVRAEKFCTGALEGFLQNGSIIKWLKRLKKLSDAFEESE